jgi:hypothetical protein
MGFTISISTLVVVEQAQVQINAHAVAGVAAAAPGAAVVTPLRLSSVRAADNPAQPGRASRVAGAGNGTGGRTRQPRVSAPSRPPPGQLSQA